MRRSPRRRLWMAAAAAVAVHVLLLGAMGVGRPTLQRPSLDSGPDVELQLLRPRAPTGSEPVTAAARQARREALAASPLVQLVAPPSSEAASPTDAGATRADAGGLKGAAGDCAPEDLPLLTVEEKARCRNQIEIARARRNGALDDAERAGRVAAMRQLPRVDGIAPGKRAYFDAVAAAERAVREDVGAGGVIPTHTVGNTRSHVDMNVHVGCSTKQTQPRFDLKLGMFHCGYGPPPGFLTEEAQVAPP